LDHHLTQGPLILLIGLLVVVPDKTLDLELILVVVLPLEVLICGLVVVIVVPIVINLVKKVDGVVPTLVAAVEVVMVLRLL
tara:strand:- start:49 stop:291 length:243 start_codon:yes stop_codon:yes gene_type:complete